MFIENDRISEVVAHFIGYFNLKAEELRLRHDYEEFWAKKALGDARPEHVPVAADFHQQYSLQYFAPGVGYAPPASDMTGRGPVEMREPSPPRIDTERSDWSRPHAAPELVAQAPSEGTAPVPSGPQPGSVAAIVNQWIGLADNDVLVMGDIDVAIHYHYGALPKFDALVGQALAVSEGFTSTGPIGSSQEITGFFKQVSDAIDNASELAPTPGISIVVGEGTAGLHVNGELVGEAPKLDDVLPEALQTMGEEPGPGSAPTSAALDIVPESSVTAQTGANLLVNEGLLTNSGLTGTFIAVIGDVHQLDAIIQINAYSDIDSVGSGFGGGATTGAGTTATYNVATFAQQMIDTAGTAAEANPGVLPLTWTVSVVEGDMVFLNWMQQYTFVSDSDVSVLTTTGVETTVTSGENFAFNGIEFADLGLYYDLIIIGGNLYDGNFICQTNVLFDDDTLELLGSAGAMDGSVSTSGNLLWNGASILNIGSGAWQQDLPDCYADAADALAGQNPAMPDSVAADPMFEGFAGLRVLYIKGNVYDLQYVEQVNVLGDADYVAAYQEDVLAAHPDTEWTIDTGSNALVNIASIIDVDGVGTSAHVGGQVYSDAILIQADIIDSGPNAIAAQGDELVSEVIAFLDDDTGSVDEPMSTGALPVSADGPPADIMQSVLA